MIIRSDEGLILETSAIQIFHGGNSTFINNFEVRVRLLWWSCLPLGILRLNKDMADIIYILLNVRCAGLEQRQAHLSIMSVSWEM